MNNKVILGILGVLLVGGILLVGAASLSNMERSSWSGKSDIKSYDLDVLVYEGWNLVPAIFDMESIFSGSEVQKEDITAMFYYSPFEKKYLQLYPNLDDSIKFGDVDSYVDTTSNLAAISSVWIYSSKEGRLKYPMYVGGSWGVIENMPLFIGWNFVIATSEMLGSNSQNTLKDIKGNCNIEKAYVWYMGKEWREAYSSNVGMSSLIGNGFIVKVSEDCNLGSSSSTIPPLPSDSSGLPDDSNNDFPSSIAGYDFEDGKENSEVCFKDPYEHNNPEEYCFLRKYISYLGDNPQDSFSIILEKVTKGKELHKKLFTNQVGISIVVVDSNNIYYGGLASWFVEGDYDFISGRGHISREDTLSHPVLKEFLKLYPSTIESSAGCMDSDGGLEYYEKGYCYENSVLIKEDACIVGGPNDGEAREAICEDNACKFVPYECPNGCSGGACIN